MGFDESLSSHPDGEPDTPVRTLDIARPDSTCQEDEKRETNAVALAELRTLANGHDAAMAGFMDRWNPMVSRLAFRIMGKGQDIDSAVQEVFVAAYLAAPKFRGDAAVSTWLYQIALRTFRRLANRERWRKTIEPIAFWMRQTGACSYQKEAIAEGSSSYGAE